MSFLWLVITSIFLTLILLQIQIKFQFSVIVLTAIVLLSLFIRTRSRRLLSDWTRGKDSIGEINFEENAVKLNVNESILHDDIKYVHFQFNYIKGRQSAPKDTIHNGLTALHITTKNDETRTIKFVIETEEQFEFLKIMFKKWYQDGIDIKEEFGDLKIKTVCLIPIGRMRYKDVQALKEEIKPRSS